MNDNESARRTELAGLLRTCRARLARPPVPGTRHRGMRQEDVAGMAGISVRAYGNFERGEYVPNPQVVDQIASALQMSAAERSALHVLATGQDPPRPPARTEHSLPGEQAQALRELVSRSPYAAAMTDDTWTVLHHNRDMNAWTGGWLDSVPPIGRHLVAYLFTPHAEATLADIKSVRRASIARLRYQYVRNLASPGFTAIIERLIKSSPAAAELWSKGEVAFSPHLHPLTIRRPGLAPVRANILFNPVTPRVWTWTMIVPRATRSA